MNRRPRPLALPFALLSLLTIAPPLLAQGQGARLQTTAFGRPALIEILDLPRDEATEAVKAAQATIAMIEASFDRSEGNSAA